MSPEQRIADAEPPPPPVVDVEVELRALRDVIAFRGLVTTADAIAITAPELGSDLAVVTQLDVSVGDSIQPGQVIAAVADRPLIALPMHVPLYRTLHPNIEGPDVLRFQRAMTDLGYPVPETGVFDQETQEATVSLYEERGFRVRMTGEDLDVAVRSAEAAVSVAETALRTARQADDRGAINQARETLDAAESDLDRARLKVGVTLPLGEVVGIDGLPVAVSSVEVEEGAITEGPILSVTGSDLIIEARVDDNVARLLAPGVPALAGDEGWRMAVESNNERDDNGLPIIRLRAVDPLPVEALGLDLRIEAELAASDGPVLAVPVAAVREGADGPIINVVDGDGAVKPIRIQPGASIGGWVEILDADEEIPPGTTVRIG